MNRDTRTGDTGTTALAPSGTVTGMTPTTTITDEQWTTLIAERACEMDLRMAERGIRPVGPAREQRWVLIIQVTGALLMTALLAAGLADNVAGLTASAAACLIYLVAAASYAFGKGRAYDVTLHANAIDAMEMVLRVIGNDRRLQAEASVAAAAACEVSLDLPAPPFGERYVYVLGFSTGTVKVGQTFDPVRRIREHCRDASAFKVNLVSYWVSPAHSNYLANEAALIASCLAVSGRMRREYFTEIDFREAVRIADGLTYYSNDSSGRPSMGGRDV